uniref:HMG box domain-containing protein n=1 Tax=Anabas testudineus TaxID=64144 RepID=A0A7N6A521_ANATE
RNSHMLYWTKENLQKLFTALKSAIPKCKTESVYTKGLKRVDWNKVAFPPFSPEACQKKWTEILSKMRKIRTLTEIIDEAEEKLSNKGKIMHPEFQKKPAPASAIFYKENWAKFQKRHPELSYGKLLKFVANKYRELPDEEKVQSVRG